MDNYAQKRNISSMQVIKTLQILLEDNYTMPEILQKLNENESVPIFNHSVVSKYINTCRFCGIKIHQIQKKYYVTDIPFGLKLKDKDIDCLIKIRNIVQQNMTNHSKSTFNKLLEKINKFANKKIVKVDKNSHSQAFEIFEQAISNRRKVRLLFKTNQTVEGIPVTIAANKGNLFFNLYIDSAEKLYNVDRVSAVQELNETFGGILGDQCVVYTLKDNLAKRYETKENEKILRSHPDGRVTITNQCTFPQILISRLMRYDECCEIEKPSFIREQMKKTIDNTLKNYGIE